MDGLIVKEPFASQLVKGDKDIEYRSKPLPKLKKNVKIFILNKGFVKGIVVFYDDEYDEDDKIYKWKVLYSKEFSPYLTYKHKNGCVIWINDVEISEQ